MPSLSVAASCAWYHSDAVYTTSDVSAAQLHRTTNSQIHTTTQDTHLMKKN